MRLKSKETSNPSKWKILTTHEMKWKNAVALRQMRRWLCKPGIGVSANLTTVRKLISATLTPKTSGATAFLPFASSDDDDLHKREDPSEEDDKCWIYNLVTNEKSAKSRPPRVYDLDERACHSEWCFGDPHATPSSWIGWHKME